MSVEITCFPRIHITLIGLNSSGYRVNGGIGFSINEPKLKLSIKEASSFLIIDKREKLIDDASVKNIAKIINGTIADEKFEKNIHVEIKGSSFSHYGLGVGTNLILASLEGLFLINQRNYSSDKLVRLSKRGGTSGIGIHTYFSGGFVFDIGRKNNSDVEFKPSDSYSKVMNIPLVINHVKMPDWVFGVCVPNIPSIPVQVEKEFFKNACPIPEEEVYRTLYHCLYGVAASIIEKDLGNFCKGINSIQNCYWKSKERALYGEEINDLENELNLLGAKCIGMSSLGPSVFFIAEEPNFIVEELKKKNSCLLAFTATPSNSGRIINYD